MLREVSIKKRISVVGIMGVSPSGQIPSALTADKRVYGYKSPRSSIIVGRLNGLVAIVNFSNYFLV
jgi:hypothetical protein